VTRTLGCARGLEPRFHDLIADGDGGYWIMCDETRVENLSSVGGVAAARVTGTVVQHVGPDGTLAFEWNPFDHFLITDLDSTARTGPDVNWTHGNALALDTDGNLLVSFRSLSEITKIDVQTGNVIWRMGGLRNEFSFVDTPTPAFMRQHGLRVIGPDTIIILDNFGAQTESHAECYSIDANAHTARQTCSFTAQPGALSLLGGSVQRLTDGHTLVSYGPAGRVEEYDATGALMWRIIGNAGYVFRAQRIASLYQPGLGTPR
jgi:hypothetical protein